MSNSTSAKATRISAVEIAVGGKKIRLSVEEAQELHKSLDELFGKAISYIPTYQRPYWEWTYPRWDYSRNNWRSSSPSSSGGTTLFSCNSSGVVSM